MALINHENAINRLKSEVKVLWKRVGEAGGVAEGGVGAWVGVGVQCGILHSQEASIGARKTPHDPQALWTAEIGDEGGFSAVMKGQLVDLIEEIRDLETKVCALTIVDLKSDLPIEVSKMKDVECVLARAVQIRSCFRGLKERGQSVHVDLEREEEELRKDIGALKDCLSEDQNFLELQNVGSRAIIGERKAPSKMDEEEGAGVGLGCKVINRVPKIRKGVQSRIDNELPRALPLFKHHWEERDHQAFVKVYHKFQENRRKAEWLRVLTYKTELEIDEHAALYNAYLGKKKVVREQLNDWKKDKALERKDQERSDMEKQVDKEKELELKKRAKEARLKREREERYQQLAVWKASRGTEEGVGKKNGAICEAKAEGENRCKMKLRAYTREERKVIAMQLHDYCQQKEVAKELENERKLKELALHRRLYMADHRSEFRKKDEEYMTCLREQKQKQVKQKDEQSRRLEKIKSGVQVNAERNKDRLLQLTRSRVAYASSPQERNSFGSVSVDCISKRSTPTWRQGL